MKTARLTRVDRVEREPQWGKCPACGEVTPWPGEEVSCDLCEEEDNIIEPISTKEAREAGAC